MSVGHLTDGGDEGEEEDAVGESETTLVGERKTMRQGGDLGVNGRGDGGGWRGGGAWMRRRRRARRPEWSGAAVAGSGEEEAGGGGA